MLSSEKALQDTRLKIRDATRQSRQAQSIEEQIEEQKERQSNLKNLEKQKREQPRKIIEV